MNYSADINENNSNQDNEQSLEKLTEKNANLSSADENEMPVWFVRLFFIMMILMILSLWLIPDEILVRWSMWWNNIPLN